MGAGQSHPSRVARVDTGCLVNAHSSDHGKHGPGGAALGMVGTTLYLVGNKGMAVYDTQHIEHARAGEGGDNGKIPRIGNIIDTGAIAQDSGCALAFYEWTDAAAGTTTQLLYLAGGKGLAVFDVSLASAPKQLTTAPIQTDVLHML